MPTSWSEFANRASAMAEEAETLFALHEVVILGTASTRGAPRLSLVEPRLIAGRLIIGVALGDTKERDLRREPRCSLHTLVGHRAHTEPVFKAELVAAQLGGDRAREIADALERPEIRWRPTAIFEMDLVAATLVKGGVPTTWRA